MKSAKIYRMSFLIIIIIAMIAGISNLHAESTFSGKRLKEACINYVYQKVGQDAEINLAQKVVDHNFEEEGVIARCTGSAESFRGLCYVIVEFLHNERLLRRTKVPVRVRLYKKVATAIHYIQSGAEIKGVDINYKKIEITQYQDKDLPEYEELIGAIAKNGIPKGAVVTKASIKYKTLIQKGDKVTIQVISGSVRIRTHGFSMQDASEGDLIKVKRNGSILQGRVARDGTVIIST